MAQWNDAKYAFLANILRNVDFLLQDPNEALDEDKIKRIYAEDLLAYGAFGSAVRAVTASANVTLVDTDPIFIEIDPNGSDRDVIFPAKSDTNHGYFVHHIGSANTLTLKRSGGATITTLVAGEIKYIKPSAVIDFSALTGGGASIDGWIGGIGTWVYASADDPTYTLTINVDVTNLICVGDKIKLTQTTAKYFIVTAISYSAPNTTTVTLFGGTDYDLANATIDNPYWSHAKSPVGFPLSPEKWTVTFTNSSTVTQASPSAGIWYNPGSQSISIPIGSWKIEMEYLMECIATVTGSYRATLSTANNSESNAAFSYSVTILITGTNRTQVNKPQALVLASKTTYYINIMASEGGQTSILFLNAAIPIIIKAICAYL